MALCLRSGTEQPSGEDRSGEFAISEGLYWGLFHLGVVDYFGQLPNDGFIGAYEEGVLFSAGLKEAAAFVRACVQQLTDEQLEWSCGQQVSPAKVDYRIVVHSLTLKTELNAFADFLSSADEYKADVQFWL